MHGNIVLQCVDAIEIAKILEYLMKRLDILAEHDLAPLLFADRRPYGLDDLRPDVTRLINQLDTSPFATP